MSCKRCTAPSATRRPFFCSAFHQPSAGLFGAKSFAKKAPIGSHCHCRCKSETKNNNFFFASEKNKSGQEVAGTHKLSSESRNKLLGCRCFGLPVAAAILKMAKMIIKRSAIGLYIVCDLYVSSHSGPAVENV